MIEQVTTDKGERYDPVTTRGQDMLYFTDHIPDIQVKLEEELRDQYSQTSADRDEETIEGMVRRGVRRTFIGGVSTLVYCDLAKTAVTQLEANRSLLADVPNRVGPMYRCESIYYRGSAKDFVDAGTSWLFGSAARVYRDAEDKGSRYHALVQGLTDSVRDCNVYLAGNPKRRLPFPRGMEQPDNLADSLKDYARHAEMCLAHLTLYDNVVVDQEMFLQWGHSYGLEEQRLPNSEELSRSAIEHLHIISRAARLKKAHFLPMAHKDPLGPRFWLYENSELNGPEDLFPEHQQLFVRNEEGKYTFRYGPLRKGPLPMIHECPGARLYRPGEPARQDAIESLFAYAECRFGTDIPRPGDGTFAATWPMLTFGTLLADETLYEAWPTQEKAFPLRWV